MFCISDLYTDGKDGNCLMEKKKDKPQIRKHLLYLPRDPFASGIQNGHFITEDYFYSKLTRE